VSTRETNSLARKLVDVAGTVAITMHDCGTTVGVTKGVMWQGRRYWGEGPRRPLAESISGRVACDPVIDPGDGSIIVARNEVITDDVARRIDELGIDKIQVRSPLTCAAPSGVCRLCYGADPSPGSLVEEGTAVGTIAAQVIGEAATLLTGRVCAPGGPAGPSEARSTRPGRVKFERITPAVNPNGENVALSRHGGLAIAGPKGAEEFRVPNGAILFVEDGEQVEPGQLLYRWDPSIIPILTEVGGLIRFEEIEEGETLRKERDPSGGERWVITEHGDDLHPHIIIEDEHGHGPFYYLPENAQLEVRPGDVVTPGALLAQRRADVSGDLPSIADIFEARRPRDPAVLAEVYGRVRVGERKRGKRIIWVQPVDDHGRSFRDEVQHHVPHGTPLYVYTGDHVHEGEPLVVGRLAPQDVLYILGMDAVQHYLLREAQELCRAHQVEIDDRHFEIIFAQMLRKVKVERPGDSGLLPGTIIDRTAFRAVNDELQRSVKIKDPGESQFAAGAIVTREVFAAEQARLGAEGKTLPTCEEPKLALCSTQLLGITKAAASPPAASRRRSR
jgi:DNA-directed RNA polymerase subunit beta'